MGADERVRDVRVSEDVLTVDLMDGRTISVPLPRELIASARRDSTVSPGDSPRALERATLRPSLHPARGRRPPDATGENRPDQRSALRISA